MKVLFSFFLLITCLCNSHAQTGLSLADTTLNWKEGYLDIHHFNTGRGNAAFCILPDGTTMLIDAGEIGGSFGKEQTLHIAPAYPNDSLTPGEWISRYITQLMPAGRKPVIDYAVITHFHGDHYGSITEGSPKSVKGPYQLSGITTVGDKIPIHMLIDRGHRFPTDLRKHYQQDRGFSNYLAFADYHTTKHAMKVAALQTGSTQQLVLRHKPALYPSFAIAGIKCSDTVWNSHTGEKQQIVRAEQILNKSGFNENPLSLALKLSYGKFDYYTGGDNTGLQNYDTPDWFDVETPIAAAVGKVEACTFDHHGNRDAMNENLLRTLAPRVLVQQTWCSDHPGQELAHRLGSRNIYKGDRDVFATYIHPETKVTYGAWFVNAYKSMEGHVTIRVLPGGNTYYVIVAETNQGQLRVKTTYGPYLSE